MRKEVGGRKKKILVTLYTCVQCPVSHALKIVKRFFHNDWHEMLPV